MIAILYSDAFGCLNKELPQLFLDLVPIFSSSSVAIDTKWSQVYANIVISRFDRYLLAGTCNMCTCVKY